MGTTHRGGASGSDAVKAGVRDVFGDSFGSVLDIVARLAGSVLDVTGTLVHVSDNGTARLAGIIGDA